MVETLFYGICDIHVYSRLRNCVMNANTELSLVDTVVILYHLYVFTIPRTLNKIGTIISVIPQLIVPDVRQTPRRCVIYIWI